MPYSKRLNSSFSGSRPLDQAFAENGGLATAKSNVLRLSSLFLKYGAESVLPRHNSAVGWPCRIMFMRARAHVATSISWPKMASLAVDARSAALINNDPEPQVGSYTVVYFSSPAWSIPITSDMMI